MCLNRLFRKFADQREMPIEKYPVASKLDTRERVIEGGALRDTLFGLDYVPRTITILPGLSRFIQDSLSDGVTQASALSQAYV